jgi:hypothetical protein
MGLFGKGIKGINDNCTILFFIILFLLLFDGFGWGGRDTVD